MNEQLHIDTTALIREIARYLAVVDAFRAELCEPTWVRERLTAAEPVVPPARWTRKGT